MGGKVDYLGNLGVGNYQRYFETSIIEHIKRLFSHMVGDYRTCSLVNGFLRASSRFPIACFPRRPHHHSTKSAEYAAEVTKNGIYFVCS